MNFNSTSRKTRSIKVLLSLYSILALCLCVRVCMRCTAVQWWFNNSREMISLAQINAEWPEKEKIITLHSQYLFQQKPLIASHCTTFIKLIWSGRKSYKNAIYFSSPLILHLCTSPASSPRRVWGNVWGEMETNAALSICVSRGGLRETYVQRFCVIAFYLEFVPFVTQYSPFNHLMWNLMAIFKWSNVCETP